MLTALHIHAYSEHLNKSQNVSVFFNGKMERQILIDPSVCKGILAWSQRAKLFE